MAGLWHQPGAAGLILGWSVDDGLSRSVTVSDCCCCWRRRRRQLITLRRATVLYSMQWLALRSVRYCRGTE